MSNDKENKKILKENSDEVIERVEDDYIKCKKNAQEQIKCNEKKLKDNKQVQQVSSDYSCPDDELTCLDKKLIEINSIREQLAKLPLDLAKPAFFTNDVEPLLKTLDTLSLATERFAVAVYDTYANNFTKYSKTKDLLNLIYDLSDTSDKVLKVLNKEIDIMLDIYRCDFKK